MLYAIRYMLYANANANAIWRNIRPWQIIIWIQLMSPGK